MKILVTFFLLFTTAAFANDIPLREHDKFAIYAIPKCGTHLIQYTISLLTGKHFPGAGWIGIKEPLLDALKTGQILRIFSPYHRKDHLCLYSAGCKLVAIARDPRDAIISLLFYMRKFNGLPPSRDFFLVEENFDQLSLDDQLHSLMRPQTRAFSYLDYYKERADWFSPTYFLTVKYEDLVGENGGGDATTQAETLFKIVDYLHLKISNKEVEEILPKLYRASPDSITVEGKTFHNAIIGNWKTFFNESHKKVFKESLGQTLIDLGYEKDLHW